MKGSTHSLGSRGERLRIYEGGSSGFGGEVQVVRVYIWPRCNQQPKKVYSAVCKI